MSCRKETADDRIELVELREVLAQIDEVQHRLTAALEQTALPDEPDRATVDAFLVGAYRRAWSWR